MALQRYGEFDVQGRRHGGVYRVTVAGDLDLATAARLDRRLRIGEHAGPSLIVVDLAQTRFMDGAGLRVLVAAHARLGRRLIINGAGRQVRRLFDLCGLTGMLGPAGGQVANGDPVRQPDDRGALLAAAVRELRARRMRDG